jgi:shikimate kinase
MIRLIGPGGAGKTSIGLALARRLGTAFVDLDGQFTTRVGDISAYLAKYGYQAYANRNFQVYLDVLKSISEETVLALSSGFMTYRDDTHPAYRGIFRGVFSRICG